MLTIPCSHYLNQAFIKPRSSRIHSSLCPAPFSPQLYLSSYHSHQIVCLSDSLTDPDLRSSNVLGFAEVAFPVSHKRHGIIMRKVLTAWASSSSESCSKPPSALGSLVMSLSVIALPLSSSSDSPCTVEGNLLNLSTYYGSRSQNHLSYPFADTYWMKSCCMKEGRRICVYSPAEYKEQTPTSPRSLWKADGRFKAVLHWEMQWLSILIPWSRQQPVLCHGTSKMQKKSQTPRLSIVVRLTNRVRSLTSAHLKL